MRKCSERLCQDDAEVLCSLVSHFCKDAIEDIGYRRPIVDIKSAAKSDAVWVTFK